MIFKLFANILAAVFLFTPTDSIFYRSPTLQEVNLTPVSGQFSMLDDHGEHVEITAMSDEQGLLYWYRRIKTPVCLTGECRLVDVGLYWDLTGDFFGLEVYGEHLTKTDHSVFSDEDYQKLMDILDNDWSVLREYDFEELTSEATDKEGDTPKDRPDATSGATRKEIASEAVENAVYTTYTLWHLVHSGEKEQLMSLTIHELNRSSLMDHILASGNDKHKLFLLDLFSQSRLQRADRLKDLIIKGLRQDSDPHLQNIALKSLSELQLEAPDIQESVAEAYTAAPDDLRLRILTALKDLRNISNVLYVALERDVHIENEWFSAKVLGLLKYAPTQSRGVINEAKKRLESENAYVRAMAEEFFKHVKVSEKAKN